MHKSFTKRTMAVLMASGILFTSAFTSFPFSIASVKGEDDVTQTEEVSATTILEGIQYPSPAGENKYQVNLSSVSEAVCEVVGNQDDNKNHIKITGVVFDDLSGLSEDTLKLTARKNANYFNENDITVEITPIDGRENAYQFVVCIYDSINENDIIDLIA